VPTRVGVNKKIVKNILCQQVWHETGTNLEKRRIVREQR